MIELKTRKAGLSLTFTILIVVISIIFFLLRGPYLSNSIKRLIIPVLENVTRERILIDKAVINLFPFYVQAKGFKIFDKDGNRLLWVTKTRAYIDLFGLLSKEIRIRRLTMIEPDLTAGEDDVKRIVENIMKLSSKVEKGEYIVTLKNLKLTEGTLICSDSSGAYTVSGTGLLVNVISKKGGPKIEVVLKDGALKLADGSTLYGGVETDFRVEGEKITVAGGHLYLSESTLDLNGAVNLKAGGGILDGELSGSAVIHMDTVNKIFGLNRLRAGLLKFDGSIKLGPGNESAWPEISFNLKTRSEFYLETLMEIVKVEDTISGKLSIDGTITGTFPDVRGQGAVTLQKAVFDTLPVDDINGEIIYSDRKFSLNNFSARVYDGRMKGTAHIVIPSGDYQVNADVSGISSPDFIEFIGWESPFQKGSIEGHFILNQESGRDISVTADVNYVNTAKSGDDLTSRLETILITLELKDNVLTLKDAILSSIDSALLLDGYIDFNSDTLKLEMLLDSKNAYDLTAPDYRRFIAPLRFTGRAEGPLEDPKITGRLDADSGVIHGMGFTRAFADLTYSTGRLNVSEMMIIQDSAVYDISGSIDFRKSEHLFTFNDPYYRTQAVVKNVSISPFISTAYKNLPITGNVDGTIAFEGDSNRYEARGNLASGNANVYGQPFDGIDVRASLYTDKIIFHSLSARNGESTVDAEGELSFDKKFNLTLSSSRIRLADLHMEEQTELNANFGLSVKGSGTLDRPELDFSMLIHDSSFSKVEIGKGTVTGRLIDKELSVGGSFVDGLVTVNAKAGLADEVEWSVDIKFERGDYKFLLSEILNDPPRDLLLSIEGGMSVRGRDDRVFIRSMLDSVNLSLYGYNFRNKGPIELELKDEDLAVKSFVLAGDNADLIISGMLKLYKEYDLNIIGSMDIAPLRALTDKVTSLRGRGSLSVNISGRWNNPELVGNINLSDATAALSDSRYKIGPMYGTLNLKKDRITFDSISTQFAGGNIVLSGAGYFKDMSMTRLYVSSDIEGIKIRPSEGISASLGGNLFYESSSKGSILTGDIDIEKAKYEKKIEWKSWLLGLKEIKEETTDYPPFLLETTLNIRIVSDNIMIDNNIARTRLKMSVNVTGNVGEYGLIGRMEADEGGIFFRSNEFNILEGSSVDFVKPGGIEPLFHIVADTYASNYYVKLSLDGTTDKFSLTLFSDPPLTETEILSLLTFGQINKEAKGIESGIAAGEATAFLTGTLQDKVEEEFKYLTGFERFDIEPHTTTEGAFSPRVIIGKRLLEDRIQVTYATSVGTAEEQIIKVEYKLNDSLSLVGSRNEIGSTGMDFKYRLEFK